MPKKKLPTGPIRIDLPTSKRSDLEENTGTKPETIKQDSGLQEKSIIDSVKKDSTIKESSVHDSVKADANFKELNQVHQQESSFTEYKKVAMRLSVEAAESLRQFRAQTGIPYEILVDVMVRNWDGLPKKTQAAYLKQAKQVRINRLMVGQEKTMKTMQQKFLNQ